MARKIILILFLPILVHLFNGCCSCVETTFLNYTNCSIELQNLNNEGQVALISNENRIPKEAYGIRLKINRSEDICRTTPTWFGSSLYAFSCECPPEKLYEPLDSIRSFSIRTINEFDTTHPAGADITEYFRIVEGTVELAEIEPYLRVLNEVVQESLVFSTDEIDLLLMSPPDFTGEHQFEVILELSDERVLRQRSTIVQLL